MTAFNFGYIPDPGKSLIQLSYASSLDVSVRRALQSPVQPLMTVVAVGDANTYLSEKYSRKIILNGEAKRLQEYEHKGIAFYRRTDLDALVIAEKKKILLSVPEKTKEQLLAEEYVPLVRRIAIQIARTLPGHVDIGELISLGYLGLLDAIRRYESEKGDIKSYFSIRIQGSIVDGLREEDHLSRVIRRQLKQIEATEREIIVEGREIEQQEVADKMGISLEQLHSMRAQNFKKMSLDLPINDDGLTIADTIASDEQTAEKQMLEAGFRGSYQKAIATLSEKRRITYEHTVRGKTLKDIGVLLGVTESRACQLLGQAKTGIKAYINREETRGADSFSRRLYLGLLENKFIQKRDTGLIEKIKEGISDFSTREKRVMELLYIEEYKPTKVWQTLKISSEEYLQAKTRAEKILRKVMREDRTSM